MSAGVANEAPRAFAVHRTGHRVRLRVPDRRGDAPFFDRVRSVMSAAPGVLEVRVDPRTASVLVRHEGDLEAVSRHVARAELLEWREVARTDVLDELREHLHRADASLHERTQGRWSLDAIAFYALVGAGIWQLAQGLLLPPGLSLLMKALSIVERREDDDAG